jgi:hypothetical protein
VLRLQVLRSELRAGMLVAETQCPLTGAGQRTFVFDSSSGKSSGPESFSAMLRLAPNFGPPSLIALDCRRSGRPQRLHTALSLRVPIMALNFRAFRAWRITGMAMVVMARLQPTGANRLPPLGWDLTRQRGVGTSGKDGIK